VHKGVVVIAALLVVVLGFVLPSVLAGGFAVNGTAITSIVVAGLIAATTLESGSRKR
jgi:hypothetical protein